MSAEERELDALEREYAEDPDSPAYLDLAGPELDLGPCEWFAGCQNEATHLEPHPILPPVPACDRCPEIGRD